MYKLVGLLICDKNESVMFSLLLNETEITFPAPRKTDRQTSENYK